ncbi:12623_t:CDS:2, partial [Entrophospora sp. SA101]
LLLLHCRSKNNQRGIEEGSAQDIYLIPDSKSINGIRKYLSKRPISASKKFYLHAYRSINRITNLMKEIEKYVKVELPTGLLTNHSGHKTVAQILHTGRC